ncbi:MAG: M56 family metallopeptidase [Pseudomonadota bacterium]
MIGSVSDNLIYVGQTTLAVTFLIGLVLLVRRPFARHFGAKAAYALWAIPAIRLVLPPLPEGWSLFSPLTRTAEPSAAEAPATMVIVETTAPAWRAPLPAMGDALPSAPTSGLAMPVRPPVTTEWVSETFAAMGAGTALLLIWLVGAMGYLAWTFYRQAVFSRIVHAEGQTPSPAVLTEAMEICQSIGFDHRKVLIQSSFISDSPFVTGLFRPVIVLPAWFELDYSIEEREVALMHELMHVKRRDLWALQASTVFLALQWFNPAAHYGIRAFRSDQEASCDADVIGVGCSTPHAYGATLMKAVRKSRPAAAPMMAASLSLTHSLTERMKQLRNPLPTVRRRLIGTALTATAGSIALIASACTTASAHPHQIGDELDGAPLQPPAPEQAVRPEQPTEPPTRRMVMHHSGNGTRIILLNNPMDDVEFHIEQVQGLSLRMEDEAFQMEALIEENVSAIAQDVVDAMAGVAEDLSLRIQSGEFQLDLSNADIEASADIMTFVESIMAQAASGEISEADIDAMTNDFEARIDVWADGIEARVEAMEPILEARVEAYTDRWNEKIEARVEAHSEAIERHAAIMETHADRIEEAGDLIGDMADDCADSEGVSVVTQISNSSGKRYRAVCLERTGGMTKEEVMAELRASGQLSDAELDLVCERFGEIDDRDFEWEFDD